MDRNREISFLYVARICFIVAMGGFLFGYDLVVVGGAKPFYESFFGIGERPILQGWVVSSAYVGCLLGALLSGLTADRLGRKWLLVFAAVLFSVSALGMALAQTVSALVVFRILCGIGIGMASTLSPMYIAEVSPSAYRGRLVAFNQLAIVIGILVAQVVNLLIAQPVPADFSAMQIAESWNGLYGWRWMFGAVAVPSALFFFLMFFVPESPRWLVKNGRTDRAGRILEAIGGKFRAEEEMREIRKSLDLEKENPSSFSDLFDARLLPVLSLGIFIAVFSQWTGINVIFNYAEEIFLSAGYPISGMMLNIVITGIVNLVFTFIAIATVDRFGRKPLFCAGAGGLAVIFLVLGTCYFMKLTGVFMLLLVVSAIACFAMTIGPVSWVMISELFPNRIRGAAMSLAVLSLWIGCTTLTLSFPILKHTLGASGTFWVYGGICTVSLLVCLRYLPETKGKSLEQIEEELIGPTVSRNPDRDI